MAEGRLITFEGPEGAGKSTLIRSLAEEIGERALVTREPGAGAFGTRIRQILLDAQALPPEEAISQKAELFLFLADRAQHVARVIKPGLAEGRIVLCDRHADSTIVYQGYGRGLDLQWLRDLNEFATDGLRPHLTLLLDLPPEEGLARVREKDRLDSEPLDFHQRVRDGFLAEAQHDPGRWRILDARAAPADLVAQARELILPIAG
jgi:dTMP kinase